MNKDAVMKVLSSTAEYIAQTQPQLDKVAADRAELAKRAQRTAGVLADRGIISADKADAFADKVAGDPSTALTFIEKIAGLVDNGSLGRPSDIEKSANTNVDPFVRQFFPELVHGNSGNID